MHGDTKTTAKPRPNAYLPEATIEGSLPIPKPYGDNAPFKLPHPNSQLRNLRKSIAKQAVI